MQDFFQTTLLPAYMAYPRFLLGIEMNETAKLIYVVLLDRARLSRKNGRVDERGAVYCFYLIEELARDLKIGKATVKRHIDTLEKAGLVRTERRGFNQPNRIYARIPEGLRNEPNGGIKNEPSQGSNVSSYRAQNWAPSNNKSNKYSERVYCFEEGESL